MLCETQRGEIGWEIGGKVKREATYVPLKNIFTYLFMWLGWVLVAARMIFSCGMWDLVSSLTRDGTGSPCIGSSES